jgi:hypothetical protein
MTLMYLTILFTLLTAFGAGFTVGCVVKDRQLARLLDERKTKGN